MAINVGEWRWMPLHPWVKWINAIHCFNVECKHEDFRKKNCEITPNERPTPNSTIAGKCNRFSRVFCRTRFSAYSSASRKKKKRMIIKNRYKREKRFETFCASATHAQLIHRNLGRLDGQFVILLKKNVSPAQSAGATTSWARRAKNDATK